MHASSTAPTPSALPPLEWPTEGESRVPFRIYTDAEIYQQEQQRIFRGDTWHFVALAQEVPNSGDYKTNHIGDTPIIIARDPQGQVKVFVNRCAHRGSLLCIDGRGNKKDFTCIYHNWSYDFDGKLQGIAFKRGVRGQGGMPEDFDMEKHGLVRLRVEVLNGLVFATFSSTVPPLRDWLGPRMTGHIARVFHRPIKVIGAYVQYLHNNWKLYVENVKDSYHASLLHTFFTTFGLNRLTMDGALDLSDSGGHHISWSKMASDEAKGSEYQGTALRAMNRDFDLQDRGLLKVWPEFEDGVTHAIQGIFPTFIVQQVQNALAVRLVVPKGVNETELQWILFGYEDDTPEQQRMRLMQSNLVGPAGLVSMEDGAVGNFVQRSIQQDGARSAVLEMGGRAVESQKSRVSEASVRGFWKAYRGLMGL
jgi:anthranilate 1,2-dioxygenase large subunit/terephthalate 1,2-dioxygenase oxygenase component alpha subunit